MNKKRRPSFDESVLPSMYFYPCENFTEINLKNFEEKARKLQKRHYRKYIKLNMDPPKHLIPDQEG